MASQGPFFPGTASSFSTGSESANPWVNPTNIGADDATEAQITAATFDSPDISEQLLALNFGFTIPGGSTIDGVIVDIDRRCFAGTAQDFRVQLRDNGVLIGNNKASASAWPGTTAVATYGTSSDVWGATLTDSIVNSSAFGVVLSVSATAANVDIGVDYIQMTVHYTPPAGVVEPYIQLRRRRAPHIKM